jgi:uncharacterized membrane protein
VSIVYWLLGLDDAGSVSAVPEWSWQVGTPLATAVLAVVGLLALIAAAINFLPQTPMPWPTRIILGLVRIAGFGVLLLMLSQLELRMKIDRELRPKVALVTDASGSMKLADVGDQSRYAAARAFGRALEAEAQGVVDVVRYRLDYRLEADSDDDRQPEGMTRLFESLRELVDRENNLQAVVLLTDGNDTTGDEGSLIAPLLASRKLPVYPVVYGDSESARVPTITLTEGGPYVRLHDELRLSASVQGRGLDEQLVTVHLYDDASDEPLVTKENVRLSDEPTDVRFVIRPDKAGNRVYRIVMEGLRDAASGQSLVAEHHVQVIDAQIRVLYLDVPRDERKFLGHWLSQDPIVDLATLTMMPKGGWYATGQLKHRNAGDGLPDSEIDTYHYDVIIFGDIPRSYFRQEGDVTETKMQRIIEFVRRRGGGLLTLGGRNVYAAGGYQGSALAGILPFEIEPTDKPQIPGRFRVIPTSVGYGHPLFQFDPNADANRDICFDLPKLDGCNRVGAVKPGASLLAVREIVVDEDDDTDETSFETVPLMAAQNVGKGRVLSFAVDTTWRWEMLRPEESEDYYRRFWGNAIRAIAPDPRITPRKPQVLRYQSRVAVGQTITLGTRLVDQLYRPIRQADVVVTVLDPSGGITTIYPTDGRQAPGLYEYDVHIDKPGAWKITTRYGDDEAIEQFEAGASLDELADPRARPDIMAALAETTGGRLIDPSIDPAEVWDALNLRSNTVQQSVTVPLWNLPTTMVLLILLVGIDCFLRKKRGMV